MSKIKTAFTEVITDLTRTVDQLERAVDGDLTIQVGGAVLDQRLTDTINRRSPLRDNVIAALSGAGMAYATVLIELLPLLAVDAVVNNESPDQYVEQFASLSSRLKAASTTYRAQKTATKADLEDAIEQSPIFYADSQGNVGQDDGGTEMFDGGTVFDENRVLATLASLGIHDVGELQQVSPGVYTGTGTLTKGDVEALFAGAEGSPFNTEAPRAQPDETWGGPFSQWPRHA